MVRECVVEDQGCNMITVQEIFKRAARAFEGGEIIFSSSKDSSIENYRSISGAWLYIIKKHAKSVKERNDALIACMNFFKKHTGVKYVHEWNDEDDRSEENVIELLYKLSRIKDAETEE